jgi:hypothetical protein
MSAHAVEAEAGSLIRSCCGLLTMSSRKPDLEVSKHLPRPSGRQQAVIGLRL